MSKSSEKLTAAAAAAETTLSEALQRANGETPDPAEAATHEARVKNLRSRILRCKKLAGMSVAACNFIVAAAGKHAETLPDIAIKVQDRVRKITESTVGDSARVNTLHKLFATSRYSDGRDFTHADIARLIVSAHKTTGTANACGNTIRNGLIFLGVVEPTGERGVYRVRNTKTAQRVIAALANGTADESDVEASDGVS